MTQHDWDEASEVTHVSKAKPDTIPAPPPTEPTASATPLPAPPPCEICGEYFGHDAACPKSQAVSPL